jgi:hypothetical protein
MSRIQQLMVAMAMATCMAGSHVWAQQAAAPTPTPTASTQSVGDAMRARTPSGVTVSEVRKEGGYFVLVGTSVTNQAMSEFMRKALLVPGALNVELRSMSAEGGQYRYEMSLKADCAAADASKAGAICGKPARAQSVYKCRINGTVTFQAAPCPPGTEL